MAILYKVTWAVRALVFSRLMGSYGLPGYLGRPAFLFNTRKMYIGRKVRIFPGLRAEVHGQGRLIIHDDVSIGQNFHVTAMGNLHIGSGCLISGDVMITDIDHGYEDVTTSLFDQPFRHSTTHIGDGCFLGIGSRIQAGTVLGRGCVVGANAVVRGTYPDYSVLVGAPARVVKQYDPGTSEWLRR